MDIDSIKSFIVMAEVGNLTEAADRLYLSPSSLTARIKKIEKEIGAELFQLVGRTLSLSPTGKVFLSYAKQFCSIQNYLEVKLSSFQEEKQMFRIASTPSISSYILPGLLVAFKKHYPKIQFKFYSCHSYMVREHLVKDEIDLGIVQSGNTYDYLKYQHWFSDRDIMVVSNTHPWANKNEVDVDALRSHPLIAYQRHTFLWKSRLAWIKDQGVNPWIGMELIHVEAIKNALFNNYGYAFLPFHGIEKELLNGELVEVRIANSPEWNRCTSFVTNKKQNIPEIYQNFIRFAIEKTKREFSRKEGVLIS
jgi:DNA-binding transcriptional LysR family regulator